MTKTVKILQNPSQSSLNRTEHVPSSATGKPNRTEPSIKRALPCLMLIRVASRRVAEMGLDFYRLVRSSPIRRGKTTIDGRWSNGLESIRWTEKTSGKKTEKTK